MNTRTTQEILQDTRTLLTNPRAWGKGKYDDGDGRYCLLGALIKTVTGARFAHPTVLYGATEEARSVFRPSFRGARDALQANLDSDKFSGLDQFNDRQSTTHEDVLALLDLTINKEQS
jgi:hypothetical protein